MERKLQQGGPPDAAMHIYRVEKHLVYAHDAVSLPASTNSPGSHKLGLQQQGIVGVRDASDVASGQLISDLK